MHTQRHQKYEKTINPQIWLEHLHNDLLPFWTSKEAVGSHGRFPTFRYNDGSVVDPIALRAEYAQLKKEGVSWIVDRIDRTYIRMISRQAYLYAVAYHINGQENLLKLAKEGVDYILSLQEPNGSFPSWVEQGKYCPKPEQRTSQDLAYALLGPALYYYLTKDDNVLEKIILAKNYIFSEYWDDSWGGLKWVKEDFNDRPDFHKHTQRELVAQLDQINGYMMLLAPILPEGPEKEQWIADLIKLSDTVEQFYDPQNNVFWGRMEEQKLGGHHVDFGHTIKSFWMLYLMENKFGKKALVKWTDNESFLDKIKRTLKEAFIMEEGTWGEKKLTTNETIQNKVWWIHAELSQMAAVIGLQHDPKYIEEYFIPACDFWFSHFVDHKHHSVWHMLLPQTNEPVFPKVHLWKNGYHSFEHALIGLIVSHALCEKKLELFFAFKKTSNQAIQLRLITPYYFKSTEIIVNEISNFNIGDLMELNKQSILFHIPTMIEECNNTLRKPNTMSCSPLKT